MAFKDYYEKSLKVCYLMLAMEMYVDIIKNGEKLPKFYEHYTDLKKEIRNLIHCVDRSRNVLSKEDYNIFYSCMFSYNRLIRTIISEVFKLLSKSCPDVKIKVVMGGIYDELLLSLERCKRNSNVKNLENFDKKLDDISDNLRHFDMDEGLEKFLKCELENIDKVYDELYKGGN